MFVTQKKDCRIPNCVSLDGRCAIGGVEVCDLFAEFFQSNYSQDDNHYLPSLCSDIFLQFPSETLCSPSISYTDICDSLRLLKSDNSNRPDNIPSVFVGNCSDNLLKPLHIIFNNCIKLG